jgi:uncharacterized membrane protein
VRLVLSKVLLFILMLTLVLVLCIYLFPSQVIRIVLGVPFLFLFPGIVLMTAIAPHRNSIIGTERIILSLVLSIVIVSLIGLILNYTDFGITLDSVIFTSSLFVAVLSAVGIIRQALLPPDERAFLDLRLEISSQASGASNTILMVIMVLVIIGAVVTGVYYGIAPKETGPFTQFYIVKQDNGAFYSPAELIVGQEASIVLGITNHEGDQIDYRVQILAEGVSYTEIDSISLSDGQEWEDKVVYPAESAGQKKIEFLLFKGGEAEPYLEPLYLWIEVSEPRQ